MRELNYELRHLCLRHRDGSYATRYDRERILTQVADQLYEHGFRHLQAKNLKPEHIEALVKGWQAEGLSNAAMKNRLCAIRWWAAKIRRPNVVARSNDAYGIGSRAYVGEVSKARALNAKELNRVTYPCSALSLWLQAVFGMRRVESIKIQPDWAVRGYKLVLENTWCMGRREREIAMDLHALMSSLQQASDLDLLRLSTAIDHQLHSPTRILTMRHRLHVGQEVHFWNLRDNRMQHGRITKFKSDQLLILAENATQYWWVPYAAIQLDRSDAPLTEPPRPLGRADFALGDTVSFEGRGLIQCLGSIVRMNQKTATVSCDGHERHVSYALLRHVVDLSCARPPRSTRQHGFRGRLR